MHPVLLCDFPVEIPVIEFAILHTVFKLLFPCFLQDVSEGVSKINCTHFFPLGRADFVLMGSAVVTDTPADCQILPSCAISFWYCSNDSGLTFPFSVSVSSANKSRSSFLCLMTTYCMGLNVMYCFGTFFLYQVPACIFHIKAVVPFPSFLPYRTFCHNRFSFR